MTSTCQDLFNPKYQKDSVRSQEGSVITGAKNTTPMSIILSLIVCPNNYTLYPSSVKLTRTKCRVPGILGMKCSQLESFYQGDCYNNSNCSSSDSPKPTDTSPIQPVKPTDTSPIQPNKPTDNSPIQPVKPTDNSPIQPVKPTEPAKGLSLNIKIGIGVGIFLFFLLIIILLIVL